MTTIYFVRHGKYENPQDIIPFRLSGYTLAELGVEQMHKAGKYFKDKDIKALFTSPIQRTVESANIISSEIGLKPVISNLIIEVDSPLQGITWKDYYKVVKDDIYTYPGHVIKGGESIEDIYNRMTQFKEMVLKDYKDSNIVALSHGDPIMIFVLKEQGHELRNHGSILKVSNYIPMGGCFKVSYNNTNQFLKSEVVSF